MLVYVTQKDIDNGVPTEPLDCPIALALRRRGVSGRVGRCSVTYGDRLVFLPVKATEFIWDFDTEQPVSPFRFTLEGV